jgi:hypothetical protein
VLAEEWLPAEAGAGDKNAALARLAIRFFAGHGPAAVQDLAWWAGLTLSEAREAVEAAAADLTPLRIGDREYWEAGELPGAGEEAEEKDAGSSVRLLAGFDEMLLGYRDRDAVLPAEVAPYVTPGNNGIFMPTIAIGGRIAGIWKRTIKPKRIDMEFRLAAPSSEREEPLLREARRYCGFMGLPLGEAAFRRLGE